MVVKVVLLVLLGVAFVLADHGGGHKESESKVEESNIEKSWSRWSKKCSGAIGTIKSHQREIERESRRKINLKLIQEKVQLIIQKSRQFYRILVRKGKLTRSQIQEIRTLIADLRAELRKYNHKHVKSAQKVLEEVLVQVTLKLKLRSKGGH